MPKRIAQCLICFSLIVAVGGHWAFLQSVAWVGMIVSYSQDAPITEALQKTFDGKHPCNLCKVVREGKQSEKQREAVKVKTKLDFWLCPHLPSLFPPGTFVVFAAGPESVQVRFESPPTPPPRLA